MTTVDRIYRPPHIQQKLRTAAGSLYGCTDTCTAMFADAVTVGGVKITEAGVRKMSSEPIPDPASPGLNIGQAMAVLWKLRIASSDKSGGTWADLMKYLDADRRVLLQLDNYTLNDCGRGRVGHAVFLQAHRTITLANGKRASRILADNPACDRSKWYPPSQLKAAAEMFGTQTGLPAGHIRFMISRIVPRIAVEA